MATTKATAVALDVPRKMLAAGTVTEAKGDHKPLVDEWQVLIGQAIDCAIRRSGLTKQAVSYAMGYINRDGSANQAPVSNWITGKETPQFAKLFAVEKLRRPLCVELSELAGAVVHTRVVWPDERVG